ncbi:signal transduction histidine kinase [Nonomuraea muscovyensis]|uniref:histidine kinase n=1 Tax=Nonomuraea muscovyensis TaxID=1124761 RepID=A0A7X0C2Z8_9ACTN|nr:HAMP domain-containing sensor histidine kinase [Nonomuraea muscovyensis]MBB6347243.1 signal transduction histidine kinase [Nonomuraea muscovyensis]
MSHLDLPSARRDSRLDITDLYVFRGERSPDSAESDRKKGSSAMTRLTARYACEEPHSLCEGRAAASFPIVPDLLRELEQELHKNRQFASDASHEMRTAFAGLRAELEEARLYPDQTDLHDLLARALRGVDRLDAILTDLRVLGEMEAGPAVEPQQVDLAELVRDEISRRVDRLPVQLWLQRGVTVQAVPIRIARLLTNLLDNAQRHAQRMIEVRLSRVGDSAEMTVADDGDGIAESERERIFQRFTRLGAAHRLDHRGTGLGLAIARDIAQAHMGTLDAGESATGGACFVLRLPLSATVHLATAADTGLSAVAAHAMP